MTRQFLIRDIDGAVVGTLYSDDQGLPAGDVGDPRQYRLVETRYVPPSLSSYQAELVDQINRAAGAFRLMFVTDVPAQQMQYLRKSQQCAAFKAAGYPAAQVADYPAVRFEAERRFPTDPDKYRTLTDEVLATEAAWGVIGDQIEAERKGAVDDIKAAASAGDAEAAHDAGIQAMQAVVTAAMGG